MIPDSRKLKRGLKDISPLFENEAAEPAMMQTAFEKAGFQLVGLFSPGRTNDLPALSRYLISELAVCNREASSLYLTANTTLCPSQRGTGDKTLSWEKFQEICEFTGRGSFTLREISHTLFLHFDYSNPEQFQKIIPMLDQWILVTRPEMEELQECYRLMKASVPLSGHLEYFLLFENMPADDAASRLFEKYGEMACRCLGIHLSWLGSIQGKNGKGFSSRLALEALFLGTSPEMESLEKRALAEFLFQPKHETVSR